MFGAKQPNRKPLFPKLLIVLVIILAVSVIPLIFLIGTQAPDARTPGDTQLVQIPEELTTDEQVVVNAHQTTVYLPTDATKLTGEFVIQPRQPDLFSHAGESEWTRPVVVDIQYRNEEGVIFPGITFSSPIRICFALTPEQWEEFTARPDDFQVQYYDEEQNPSRWISLPMTMDPERSELCSKTDHLSIYALAVRSTDEIPNTGGTRIPTLVPTPTPFPTIAFGEGTSDSGLKDNPRPTLVIPTNTPWPTQQPTQIPVQPSPTRIQILPTIQPPTILPPTNPPPTSPPPTNPPTDPPPTDPPATEDPIEEPTDEPISVNYRITKGGPHPVFGYSFNFRDLLN